MTRTPPTCDRRFMLVAAFFLAASASAISPVRGASQESAVDRAIPAPVAPPPEYQRAVERGWRSADFALEW